MFLEDVDLANFADDNTIYTINKNVEVLILSYRKGKQICY